MISFIIEAAQNFYVHQIQLPYSSILTLPKKRTLLAYLDVESKNGGKHRVYIGCDDVLIQCIAEIFLGEELSDTETLKDMLLETTNMIVGSAKVLAEEQARSSFTISTPHFFDHNPFAPATDENYSFTVGEGEMIIAIKAL